MIDVDELREALYSATTVEPRNPVRNWSGHGGRPLGEWHTIAPDRRKSMRTLRRQILAFLVQMNEDDTVADLRESFEALTNLDD